MKLGQLKAAEQSIGKLLNCDLPIKEAYQLSRMIKKTQEYLTTAEEIRNNLVKKYGTVQDDKSIKVMSDKIQFFVDEYNKLLDIDIDLKFTKIGAELLNGAKLSPIDINNLEFILEEKSDGN